MRAVDPRKTRVVFAGTPAFAVASLEALLDAEYAVVGVYTQPDRPAGRGRRLMASPVKQRAQVAGIPVYQPATLRDPEARAQLAALAPQVMVVAAYGLILPKAVLAIPPGGCINVHASLLPRWRGAAPIQRALLAGDSHTGVSIMLMTPGLDEGPVLGEYPLPIPPGTTGGELHDRLATLGGEALMAELPGWLAGTTTPVPQDAAAACYAPKLTKAEAHLDWCQSAKALERQILAFNPWPVAQTRVQGEVLRVWQAAVEPALDPHGAPPGQVIQEDGGGVVVAAGEGALRLSVIQWPGRRPVAAAEASHARSLAGQRLGEP
ncbi:MAG: methionyl-tRNA formyltransferase [Candidatus Competibacterales bacterium]